MLYGKERFLENTGCLIWSVKQSMAVVGNNNEMPHGENIWEKWTRSRNNDSCSAGQS